MDQLHIVLYQPEIPHNTGAVGRLCLASGARLHLIHPLGFSLEDKYLKRSGLDYWQDVDVREWQSFEDLVAEASPEAQFWYLTTKTERLYWEQRFTGEEIYLVFGRETRGLPESLREANADRCLTIPMQGTRSLNLSTSVGIVMYEVLRQRALD